MWVARATDHLEKSQKEDPSVVTDEANKMALLEVKGDRQPVGKFVDKRAFLTTSLQLIKGDILYIFTDGFPDQFGGPKGKKFKYQTFKKLLLSNAHLSMQKQKEILSGSLKQWQREFEQTDDICVIGIKI
ncbi:MAG: SpoIIE family protein phosphatase [Crocinitomicaceae bacterium]|nr:SpoIIE family protein phosphatase [Crocinitomicaceae bacterium]